MKINSRIPTSSLHIALRAIFCAIIFQACSPGGRQESFRRVSATIPPIAFLAEAIGGDSIEVNTIIDASADPETFQPGMESMRGAGKSDAIFTTGLLQAENMLLGKMADNNSRLRVAELNHGIRLIYGTHSHEGDAHARHNHNEQGREPDPHIWSSVKNMRVMAGNMFRELSELYPASKNYFAGRYHRLDSTLAALDSAFAIAVSPEESFAIWHPSLSYLARDYNLRQIAVNLENKETSAQWLARVVEQSRRYSPVAFFVQTGTNRSTVASVASELNLRPVEINFMSGDWQSEMNRILASLSTQSADH